MSPWIDWMAGARLQPLVFALFHTLWIALLSAASLGLTLRYLPASRAELRYAASLLAQLTIVLAALVTWAGLDLAALQPPLAAVTMHTQQGVAPAASRLVEPLSSEATSLGIDVLNESGRAAEAVETVEGAVAAVAVSSESAGRQAWMSYVAAIWLAGVVLMLFRMALAVADAGRFVRHSRAADSSIVELVDQLRQELGIARRVRVVISQFGNSPAVAGVIWPALILPVSLLTELSPQAIRAILLHELAHIRRHDYLVNLAQMLIESVFFFQSSRVVDQSPDPHRAGGVLRRAGRADQWRTNCLLPSVGRLG